LYQYFRLVNNYISINSTSKRFLHNSSYDYAKEHFRLNTALTQTARDKAVEILRSFNETKKEGSVLQLKRISIRFDRRCFQLSKTTNTLTPYWLTLSLSGGWGGRVSLPIVLGRRGKIIGRIFTGEFQLSTVEMVKRNGKWFAHFTITKQINLPDETETVIAIDRGERNLAVAVAVSKQNSFKPIKGLFWSGADIKRIRGKYGHIRRNLQKKKLVKKVKSLQNKERRIVKQLLHQTVNSVIQYTKQFLKPIIVMEDLYGLRGRMNFSKRLNKRLHQVPFYKFQRILEYKALLNYIPVKYLTKAQTKNTSKTCHRCDHISEVNGREYHCSSCNVIYDRDLNASINIAHRITRSMGWGISKSEHPKPANEAAMQNHCLTLETAVFKWW